MPAKIGLGIITCNRLDFFKKCFGSIPFDKIDELVIVNDGKQCTELMNLLYTIPLKPHPSAKDCQIPICSNKLHNNETNLGVGKSKNKALQHLLDAGCDHIFLMEDDMIVKDPNVFDAYIKAAEVSGILHFNYGPGSPFNRKQDPSIRIDLDTRHLLKQDSEPNPKMIVEYKDGVKVALYEHTVAMFSYFHRKVLEKVGLHDEQFYNAWEHVDLTYRIAKDGFHPPFWWFADIANSHEMLTEAPGAINNSSIANNNEQWKKNVYGGREKYLAKHGHYPNQPPLHTEAQVIDILKKLKL